MRARTMLAAEVKDLFRGGVYRGGVLYGRGVKLVYSFGPNTGSQGSVSIREHVT